MSIRQALIRAAPKQKSSVLSASPLSLTSREGWLFPTDEYAMSRDRAMKISTVNRCVEVLSGSMAVLPTFIMQEDTKQRIDQHRLGRVLWGRPNELMTSFDYARLMACNQILRGNAYAWIHRDPSSGYVRELIPLPPDHVTIYMTPTGELSYVFTHPQTGEVFFLNPAEVLHYKAYSEDGIEGISVLKRASLTLSTAYAAQQYEHTVWQNGGQPSGILTTDSDLGATISLRQPDGTVIQKDAKDHLREQWERFHRGPTNAFRVAVLDLGLKYQPISMTNADAQFVESNEVRVADVCRFFGVPLHLVFAGKQSYQSNEQNGIEYVTYTLLGYETQWSQEDTYKLLLPSERRRNYRIRRELKIFLKGDTAAQQAWYKTMREIGVYSSDEIRALDDRPAVPGGDSYYASLNFVPQHLWPELSMMRAGGTATKPEGEEP